MYHPPGMSGFSHYYFSTFTSMYHPPGMSGFSHYYFSTSHRCITLQVCQGSVIITSVLSHRCITLQVCQGSVIITSVLSHRCITLQVCQGSVIITSVLHIDVSPSRYVRVQSLLLQYFTSVYHPPGMSGFSHYYFSTSHRCITLQVCQGSVDVSTSVHISPYRYVRVQSLLLQYFTSVYHPPGMSGFSHYYFSTFTSMYHPPGMSGFSHYYFSTSHRCITLQLCQGSVIIASVLSHRCITLQVCQGSVIITSVFSHRCITLQVCQGSVIITSVLSHRCITLQVCQGSVIITSVLSHRCITLQVCQGSVIITSVLHIGVSPSRYVRVQSLLLQYFTSVYHPPGMSGFSHYYFSTSHRCITLQVCQGSVIITSVLHIGVSPSRYVRVQSLLLQYFTSVYHPPGMSGFSHYYFSTSHRCITLQVCQGSVIITSVLHIGVSPYRYVRVQSLLLQYFTSTVSPSRYVRVQSLLLQYFHIDVSPSRYVRVQSLLLQYFHIDVSPSRYVRVQSLLLQYFHIGVSPSRYVRVQSLLLEAVHTCRVHIVIMYHPPGMSGFSHCYFSTSHDCITLQVCQGSVIITSVLHIGVSPSRYVRVQSLLLQYFTSVYHPPGMSGFSHYYFSTSHRCITLTGMSGFSHYYFSTSHRLYHPDRYVRVQSLLLK